MASLAGEKRKNDEQIKRRGLPWWLLLLVGFALGVIFTLSVSMRSGTTTVYSLPENPDASLLQATQIVIQATLTAQAPLIMQPPLDPALDPLLMEVTQLVGTATAEFVGMQTAIAATGLDATQQAQAAQNYQIASQFDPFAATATAIILQATQAANP